jgi:hypothetical protein
MSIREIGFLWNSVNLRYYFATTEIHTRDLSPCGLYYSKLNCKDNDDAITELLLTTKEVVHRNVYYSASCIFIHVINYVI